MNHRNYRILLWICCTLTACTFIVYSLKWMSKPTHGFAAYYTSSRMVLEGDDFRSLYDYQHFNEKIHSYGMNGILDAPNNIPTNALSFLPVAWLSPREAKILWTFISLILFALSLSILFRVFDITLREDVGIALLALVFLWHPSMIRLHKDNYIFFSYFSSVCFCLD